MSFLTQFFIKPTKPVLLQVPDGSFMVDRNGQIMSSTLPRWFSTTHVRAIADQVLATFRSAEVAKTPLAEIIVQYSALKLVARGLPGGVIVFLMA